MFNPVFERFFARVETTFVCSYCGESNDLFIDVSEGLRQEYVEDCQVCCQPNVLTIVIFDDDEVLVTVRKENE